MKVDLENFIDNKYGGANIGFRSSYTRFGGDRLSNVFLTNTDKANPRLIANALADYYLEDRQNEFLYPNR